MGYRKGFTLLELIVVVAILAILFSIFAGKVGFGRIVGGVNPTMSQSSRTGTIVKFGEQTNFLGYYKSWEGAMQMSQFDMSSQNRSGSTMNGNVWEFSLYENADKRLTDKILLAQKLQKPITLTYSQWYSRPATISTEYVITGAEFPEEAAASEAAVGKPKGH